MKQTGHYAVLDQLIADDVQWIFGNPGTVEQGFLDALSDRPRLKYLLTLQESIAIYAADAYARASRGLAVAQIHSSPGLGNAIGALYQAYRGNSPILVLGGDAGVRYQAMDAQMAADLVAMAEPVTKASMMVQHPTSLLRVLRRATKLALTPPMGPVYVCLPQDVLDEVATEPVVATSVPSTRVLPAEEDLDEAVSALALAERPTIFVGDGVAKSGAQGALGRLAEQLGADVWGVDGGDLNLSWRHPLWRGQTGHMFGSDSLPITRSGDVNLVVGTYMMPEVFPTLEGIFGQGARTIHVDLDTDAIAKNHPVDLGLLGDPARTLESIGERLTRQLDEARRQTAERRVAAGHARRADVVKRVRAATTPHADGGDVYLRFGTFMKELVPRLPADAIVFDEALTNSPTLTAYLEPDVPGRYFQTRGGSLGTAMAGGLGLQAAAPDAPVFVFTGDGGGMYVVQALWSAVRHDMPIIFIVCNNRSYRLLQANIRQFWEQHGIVDRDLPLAFDLSRPELDFAEQAAAYGLASQRVETADDIVPAIERALAHPGPFLLDVILEGDVHPELVGVACGQ